MAAMIFKVPPQGGCCIWFDDYVEAVEWAQDYALANGRMSNRIRGGAPLLVVAELKRR